LQRELRAITSYFSQQHNDIFQKHFHNSIKIRFLDINWSLEKFSDIEQGIHTQFIDNLEGTVNKIGKGRTEVIYTYDCNNHYANEEFKYFFENEIEIHAERLIDWWLDDLNNYIPITQDELNKISDTLYLNTFSYKYEIKT